MTHVHFERTQRRLSQKAVADLTGICQPTVSHIELGRVHPTPDELRRLAAVFGLAPEDLLTNVTVLEPRP